jgi:hypothetical protein
MLVLKCRRLTFGKQRLASGGGGGVSPILLLRAKYYKNSIL